MNIHDVNRAADAYLETAEGPSAARLRFLKSIWQAQSEIEGSAPGYVVPDAEAAHEALATGQPLFLVSEPVVPADSYRDAVRRIVGCIVNAEILSPEQTQALRDEKIGAAIASALTDGSVTSATHDIEAFVDHIANVLAVDEPDASLSRATLAFVLVSALVPFLTGPSAAAISALGNFTWSVWGSGNCPVCGSASALGRMTESNALQGSARHLWCSQCHAEWDFERIRCARCGTRTAHDLHYTHEEHDPAHRLHLCDHCHGYLKVTFEDELRQPLSMVVEEAASVTLDAIAYSQGYAPEGDGGVAASELH